MTKQRPLEQRIRRNAADATRRVRRARKRALLAAAEVARLAAVEVIAEYAAPAIMRRPILNPDGSMLRGALVGVIDGIPARVDPVASLRLSKNQRVAARQFLADYREVGGGINVSAIDWDRSPGSGGGSGADRVVLAQIATRARLEGALAWMGALSPMVVRLVVDCVPLDLWAASAEIERDEARALFAAALDRLFLFYDAARDSSRN